MIGIFLDGSESIYGWWVLIFTSESPPPFISSHLSLSLSLYIYIYDYNDNFDFSNKNLSITLFNLFVDKYKDS